MISSYNNYNEVQFEKYFLRWYRKFNVLNHNANKNPKTFNLVKQLSNVVLKNTYLRSLNVVILGSNNKIKGKIFRLLLSISNICIKSKYGLIPILSIERENKDPNLEVIRRCHIILYRLLPCLIMMFLSIRSPGTMPFKLKKNLYSLLINISQLVNKNIMPKQSDNNSLYTVYKSMPKGNAKYAFKNAIIHIYRLKTCNFKLSDKDIFKEFKKIYNNPQYKNNRESIDTIIPPQNCFLQKNNSNIGSIIIKCIEFIEKGLRINIGSNKTRNSDRLLLKSLIKMNKIDSNYFANDNQIELHKFKLIKGNFTQDIFRDSYLKVLELLTDSDCTCYNNIQSIELNNDDLTRLIITHGEIRRLIWGPSLIRHMKPDRFNNCEIINDEIIKIKKFSNDELDRVLEINNLLERMSLTLGFGRSSWLAAAQNHTDSYILKS